MPINNDIIKKLTVNQKIALLTDLKDVIEKDEELSEIPKLSVADLWQNNVSESGENIFPSFAELANSWDEGTLGDVAVTLACMGARKGENLFVLPKMEGATSVYSNSVTEDPYLMGLLYSATAKALDKEGVATCIQAPSLTETDEEVHDKEPNEAVLFERFLKPFETVKTEENYKAILIDCKKPSLSKSYGLLNEKLLKKSTENQSNVIARLLDGDSSVAEINKGNQILNGSALALDAAYKNYKKIYHAMEEGGASANELQMAFLDGSAISEEMIDNALDAKLTLANDCQSSKLHTTSFEIKGRAIECAKRTIVMLKNDDGVMPLEKGLRVSVIGDVINDNESASFCDSFMSSLSEDGISVLGYQRGYDANEDKSEELIYPALSLAQDSDVVILFLGMGAKREKELSSTRRLQLPANQKELVSKISEMGKYIIAVMCGSRLPNMDFDDDVSGVLLSPRTGIGTAIALKDIIMGHCNPIGRLAYAGYNNIDKRFREIQSRKRKGEQKIGHFIGYRYTDSCNMEAKYPFGYGISYTKFSYSSLFIRGNTVSFDVQNDGPVSGVETVQVYVGNDSSADVRPLKELRAVCRISLKPNEKKRVEVSLNDLKIYDTDSEKFTNETGDYTIYVGSSASDIHLIGNAYFYGEKLRSKKQHLSEYLYEVSNIRSEGYIMEAYCKPMNNVSKIKSVSLWLLALTVFFDMIYGICGLLGMPIKDHVALFVIITVIFLLASAITLCVYLVKKKETQSMLREKEEEATKELFKNAEKINVGEVEKLFNEEFDIPERRQQQQQRKTSSYMGKDESIYVYMAVDTDFSALCKDMEKYFQENGLTVTPATCRAVVSSMMSSRLLVLRHDQRSIANKFTEALARFFGTECHFNSFQGVNWEKSTLMSTVTEHGAPTQTGLAQAFTTAMTGDLKVSFYAMTDVKYEDTAKFMMPYVQFLGNPTGHHTVSEKGYDYTVPNNMWFVIIPKDGQTVDNMPAFVSNLASVIDLDVQSCESTASAFKVVKPINSHQLEALQYRSKKSANIDESIWKTVDSLEAFVNERTSYHIGNKIFLQLESYLSVYLACGGEIEEALDGALASRLLPAIFAILKNNVDINELDLPHTLESIFGEENVSRSCRMVKSLKADSTKEAVFLEETEKVDLGKETEKIDLSKPINEEEAPKIHLSKSKITLTKNENESTEGVTDIKELSIEFDKD